MPNPPPPSGFRLLTNDHDTPPDGTPPPSPLERIERLQESILAELIMAREGGPYAPTPVTAIWKVVNGAMAGVRWGTLAVGVLGVASVAAKIWRPELVGPLETLKQIAGAQ
jgi:hypothetical protein